MSSRTAEKAYEKFAWVLFVVLGILGIVRTIGILLGSPAINPDLFPNAIDFAFPSLWWSILIIAISAVGYRKGERWAWYVSWHLPVAYIGVAAYGLSVGGSRLAVVSIPIVAFVISLTALLLPYRKFFPKKQASMA